MIVAALISLIVLFLFSAFFSSAESALFTLDSIQVHRIKKKHTKAAARIDRILSAPTKLLSAILIGNTLVNVAASSIGYNISEQLLPQEGIIVAIPVMTILLLIFGEISPKRLALQFPERLAVMYSIPLGLFMWLMTPLTVTFVWITNKFKHWMASSPKITEDEFKTALHESEKTGLLDKEERSIVEGIIRLEGLTAGDVMTPRVDVVFVDLEKSVDEIVEIVCRVKHKFLPVFRKTTDTVLGFLDVRSFLLSDTRNVEESLLPPMFIPMSTPLDRLMSKLQKQKRLIACIVDEFSGTAGIVTKGDIMEEIIHDEHENIEKRKSGIESVTANRWLLGGETSLEEVNSKLDLHLEAEGAIRISGWVSSHLERIPRRGDIVTAQNCRVIIRNVKERRIISVVLEKMKSHREDH